MDFLLLFLSTLFLVPLIVFMLICIISVFYFICCDQRNKKAHVNIPVKLEAPQKALQTIEVEDDKDNLNLKKLSPSDFIELKTDSSNKKGDVTIKTIQSIYPKLDLEKSLDTPKIPKVPQRAILTIEDEESDADKTDSSYQQRNVTTKETPKLFPELDLEKSVAIFTIEDEESDSENSQKKLLTSKDLPISTKAKHLYIKCKDGNEACR